MSTTSPSLRLSGHLAPVADEIDATDLPVEGTLPPELTGRYLRNGPNPLPGEQPAHWFTGHGMIHGIRLRAGRAEWYRNRWVRTSALEGEQMLRPDGTIDRSVGVANTHVIAHAGRILALVESSFPQVMTPDLGTMGPCDFDGRLTTAMTAHPKTDPVTGDLHFFGYDFRPPYLTYHRLSADGELVASAEIDVPGPTMMHDFAITDRHAVFLDLPMTFQIERLASGMPYGWDDRYDARLGIMSFETPGEVAWFDVEPSYVFHVGNAHTDSAGRVVLDGARYAAADARVMWEALGHDPAGLAADAAATGAARFHRWTLDPATGTATETALDDRVVEFPTVDDERVGREARYRYAVSDARGRAAIVRFDAARGTATEHVLGADTVAGEAVFVPSVAPGRAEDDGWLLSIATRRDGSASRLLVLDATDVAGPPVAAVTLPRGVPSGFHGSWIDDSEIGG
ncbi:carotenoid oxygenase family protein [Pseudonocardia asaccharolytica]|uniref:Dioxygenase n=1 Tax=Pseudonocardia asaccharolytica DSM 44247 = NBRC 16224 TaxID=1123024 RepID=A0A511D1U3_9PSEU|nr:carotenoid oxygenase family protein [Pseudonocardia asaccharolytica]GEL17514.1 retinal pigment epithelial membrane protein [Pseudonocardia asaccharolytica DSM 44247 = NBRC 16224]